MSRTEFTKEELQDLEDEVTLPLYVLFPLGVLGLYSLANPWPVNTVPVYLAWLVFTTFVFFCYTSCFHESAHQTLNQSSWFSVIVGRIIGTLIFTPYTVYRESHIRHHAYLNKPTDFELWPYSDPTTSVAFRRVFVWLDLLVGIFASPFVYGRTFFHKDSPIRAKSLRRMVYIEYVMIVIFWTTALSLIAINNWWLKFALVWALPHWLAGIMQTGRKLTEHLGMSSYDPLNGTRTVVADNWFTRFCTWMNFDIFVHGPHHRHPKLAHNRLLQKVNEYKESTGTDLPVFPTYRAAFLGHVSIPVSKSRRRHERWSDVAGTGKSNRTLITLSQTYQRTSWPTKTFPQAITRRDGPPTGSSCRSECGGSLPLVAPWLREAADYRQPCFTA